MPPELGKLTKLEQLSLSLNQLSGEIPPELGNLTYLTSLDLFRNNLSGEIPPELGNLTYLTSLDLFENNLSGEIPSELGSLTKLTRLSLDDNLLNGEIPSELASLPNLERLNLKSNRLSGGIPSELGSRSRLTLLNLADNQLTGNVPHELASVSSLTSLYLAGNRLTGCIPDGLQNVAENDLSGLNLLLCTVVRGTILYDGRPLPETTDVIPRFSVFTRQEPRTPYYGIPLYDSSTGRYEIPNPPPAIRWSLFVLVDSGEPFNGKSGYALDFEGLTSFEILEGQTTLERDLDVRKVIHLTGPVDNKEHLGHTDDPEDTYAAGPLLFTWEPVLEAASYGAIVTLYREPYTTIKSVFSKRVTDNSFEVNLPTNNAGEFYSFQLDGLDTDGARIAWMRSPYSNGHGWDYKFRIR